MQAEDRGRYNACAECKAKKIRCIRSSGEAEICDRCRRMDKDCRVPEIRKRAPKSRVRFRLEQLENHYGEILSLLSVRPQSSEGTASRTATEPQALSESAAFAPTPPNEQACYGTDGQDSQSDTSTPPFFTAAEANELLDRYRQMSRDYFPYVLITNSSTLNSLQAEKPLLLQAILIVSSWKDRARQTLLLDHFLKQLSQKVLLNGEKSLELLQALLVYCAWYHFCSMQGIRPAYRFVALAVTMALDLGLDRNPTCTTQHDMIVISTSMSTTLQNASTPKSWSHEARRAFVGAYSLSAYYKILFRIPSPIAYTRYLEDVMLSLAKDAQSTSDTRLVHRVRLTRIAIEVSNTFDHGSDESDTPFCDEKIHMLVKAFERQLTDWRSNLPASALVDVDIDCSSHIGAAYLHEVGLYGIMEGQPASAARISIMYECLASIKQYTTNVSKLSVQEMLNWTGLNWRCLNYSVMLWTKISVVLNSTAPSVESSLRLDKIDLFLNELKLRAKSIQELIADPQSSSHFFQQLPEGWDNIRRYIQIERAKVSTEAPQIPLSNTIKGIQPLNPTEDWNQGQDFLWAGFDSADLWGADESWLRTEFATAAFEGVP